MWSRRTITFQSTQVDEGFRHLAPLAGRGRRALARRVRCLYAIALLEEEPTRRRDPPAVQMLLKPLISWARTRGARGRRGGNNGYRDENQAQRGAAHQTYRRG